MFHVDCYGSYGGYFFDFARSRCVGDDPTAEQRSLLEAVIEGVETICAAIKPGLSAGDVYDVGARWLGESPVASAHGGQGIGLYLAQSAARQLGGQISWHDNPAGGTVLELRLPLTAASERAIAAQPDFQP